MIVRARILCLATYDAEVDVPNDWNGTLKEYINDNIADLQVENLQFFEDLNHEDNRVAILEVIG